MIQLVNADFFKFVATIPDNSVDAIITDPPYLKKYLYLYEKLGLEAKRILKSEGSLISIVPHFGLSQVLFDVGKYLKYRWIFCMWQYQGNHPRMNMGIEVVWKPIVWWVKDKFKQNYFVRDGFENLAVEKGLHDWQQSIQWAEYCLDVVKNAKVILDPFMGVGTVGVVCKQRGLDFIGCEIDEKTFLKAKERIESS